VCINVHSVNIVKLLTLTLSWIIIIVSFNDTGFGGELWPHSPRGVYDGERVRSKILIDRSINIFGSVTSTGSLKKLPRNPCKVAKFWFSFGVKN